MLILSLDESGGFENGADDGGFPCQLIGGIVFQAEDSDAIKHENNRIKAFLMAICSKHGGRFPSDLHLNADCSNHNVVRAIKRDIIEQLPCFFQGSGKFSADNAPSGKYSLYCLSSAKRRSASPSLENVSNLIAEDIASNRYEHMVYYAVENALFYDLSHTDKDNILRLATRTIPLKGENAEQNSSLRQEYKQLGYTESISQSDSAKCYISITTPASFRTALRQMSMQNTWREGMQVDLKAKSIDYRSPSCGNSMCFLYLADIICSVYRNAVSNLNVVTDDRVLDRLDNIGGQMTGGEYNSFWAYNDLDLFYRRAFMDVESGNIYSALLNVYEASLLKDAGVAYYKKRWYPQLKSLMKKKATPLTIQSSLEYLRSALYSADFSLVRCSFILNELKDLAQPYEKSGREVAMLYHLYVVEMTVANHCGKYDAAQQVYEKACNFAKDVNIEDYLELRNLYAVSLTDAGRAEEALSFTTETLRYEQNLIELRSVVIPDAPSGALHAGRSESQLGQCYAFCGRWDEAAQHFEKALKIFGADDPVDRQRTLSYYLHALIEQSGGRDIYERYASEYFGAGSDSIGYEKQLIALQAIIDSTSRRFALYVYIKALFVFYRKKAQSNFVKAFLDWIDSPECAAANERNEHPWEIIYKYCAALCIYSGDKERASTYQEKAAAWLDDSYELLHRIAKNGDRELEEFKKKKSKLFYDGEPFVYMYR